jgi:hypothetical protein
MRYPEPEEEYITILDNRGRERIQHVEYLVTDVQGDTIYVTDDGLAYIHDALVRKGQEHLLDLIESIPMILANPQIVVADHLAPDDTLLYYGYLYIPEVRTKQLMCIVVKVRWGLRFVYNFFPQQSGKVKG